MSSLVVDPPASRPLGDVFSLLQAVRANTYGQIVVRQPSLFGFFHNRASYILEQRHDARLRLFGFVGYVAYSVESGSLRRHKTLAMIEEANAEAATNIFPARYHVTPRQMICLVCEGTLKGTLKGKIEETTLPEILTLVVQILLFCAPLTARIQAYAVPGENLRSL